MGYFWGWGWGSNTVFALSCSFEFLWVVVVVGGGCVCLGFPAVTLSQINYSYGCFVVGVVVVVWL